MRRYIAVAVCAVLSACAARDPLVIRDDKTCAEIEKDFSELDARYIEVNNALTGKSAGQAAAHMFGILGLAVYAATNQDSWELEKEREQISVEIEDIERILKDRNCPKVSEAVRARNERIFDETIRVKKPKNRP